MERAGGASSGPTTAPGRAGLAAAGAILVRPDGQIGFRANSADPAALAALDAHLGSYLVAAEACLDDAVVLRYGS